MSTCIVCMKPEKQMENKCIAKLIDLLIYVSSSVHCVKCSLNLNFYGTDDSSVINLKIIPFRK